MSLWDILNSTTLQLVLAIITIGTPVIFLWKICLKYCFDYHDKQIRKHQIEFYKQLNSVEYQDWRDQCLKKIYGEKYFTEVFGVSFPAFSIPFNKRYTYKEFQKIYAKEDIDFSKYRIENNEVILPEIESTDIINKGTPDAVRQKKEMLKEYAEILKGSIRYPLLIGFMLDHYKFNDKKEITHIYPKLGNFGLNVYSSHILEYELFRAYKKFKGQEVEISQLWDALPFRHYVHFAEGNKNNVEAALYTGAGRYSLFSVQCLVMFMDHNKQEYVSLLMKRSTDPQKIAAKLGFYQFFPAGGFELYEKERIHSVNTIIENYSLRKAILREYLEEVFGLEDFQSVNPENNKETTYTILNHSEVECILKMVEKGTASFELLGVAVDLVTLRHELSFILKIDDISYSKKEFCPNEEFTRENSIASKIRIPVSALEKLLYGKQNIDQASAILYDLVKKSPLFPGAKSTKLKKEENRKKKISH